MLGREHPDRESRRSWCGMSHGNLHIVVASTGWPMVLVAGRSAGTAFVGSARGHALRRAEDQGEYEQDREGETRAHFIRDSSMRSPS